MMKLSVSTTFYERLWGWIYCVLQLLILPSVLIIADLYFALNLSDGQLNFIFFGLNFICVTVIFHRFLLQNGKIALDKAGSVISNAFIGFMAYMILSHVISLVITAAYPDFYNVNDSHVFTMVEEDFFLMAAGTIVLVPITEEVLYRGLVFAGLYSQSRVLSYSLSTLLFCAVHVVNYIGLYEPVHLLLCFVEYIPAGLCLGWAYAKTDTIWTPILIHMAVNAIGVLAMR